MFESCIYEIRKRGFFFLYLCGAAKHDGAFCHRSSPGGITQHDVTVHSAAQQVALGF